MGASPAVRCSAWLAEYKVSTRVYGYGSIALPCLLVQRICRLVIAEPLTSRAAPLAKERPSLVPRGSRALPRNSSLALGLILRQQLIDRVDGATYKNIRGIRKHFTCESITKLLEPFFTNTLYIWFEPAERQQVS